MCVVYIMKTKICDISITPNLLILTYKNEHRVEAYKINKIDKKCTTNKFKITTNKNKLISVDIPVISPYKYDGHTCFPINFKGEEVSQKVLYDLVSCFSHWHLDDDSPFLKYILDKELLP